MYHTQPARMSGFSSMYPGSQGLLISSSDYSVGVRAGCSLSVANGIFHTLVQAPYAQIRDGRE